MNKKQRDTFSFDDKQAELEAWQSLDQPERAPLIEAVKAIKNEDDFNDLVIVNQLRRHGDMDQVRLTIELIKARHRARKKFDRVEELMLDRIGVEQASDKWVAEHKARRFAEAGIKTAVDICCGVGGDAMALAKYVELSVLDRDPVKTWMTAHNVKVMTGDHIEVINERAEDTELGYDAFHFDPDRRSPDRSSRTWKIQNYRPGPNYWRELFRQIPHGAIKLGPGVRLDELPPSEVEFIRHRRNLVQAVLWMGDLRQFDRKATNIDLGLSLSGSPEHAPVRELSQYLYVVDKAVERAGLSHMLCEGDMGEAHPGLGYLTSATRINNDWLRCYRVEHRMGFRPDKVRAWLREQNAGEVTVKTRGVKERTDQLQLSWSGSGDRSWVVFIVRLDVKVEAWITEIMK